ncbi:type II toxin-antitoxin system VapC family toxin [Phormidesmis priestleyi]|uniref:type II toxin-antitoxin system VapC family toxin n=1 Tax=Phormidesmis priestleyi TaxID=268141 RepID=UPI00083A67D3|nr:type II toxin-antitoxin system VapC family toxin [Phormidesmis priestleyi]
MNLQNPQPSGLKVTLRLETQPSGTIVTVQEIFNGWMGRLNNLSDLRNLTVEYENLRLTVEFIRSFRVLKFDAAADDCYVQILQANPPLRKKRLRQDMRIAAIALSLNATVVTRDRRDFEQMPGLAIVDWSTTELIGK